MIRLVIVNKVTPSLNVLMRRHFRVRFRDKAEWSALLLYAMRRNGLTPDDCRASGKRRLTIERYERGAGLDRDNLFGGCKDLIDSIKKHGLIIDDKPEHCELVITQHKPLAEAKKHLVITLEDIT